jgi:dTDP-glucose 4,6-dehydratase
MKILVTGGAGFIGSHLVRHLLQQRSDVEVVTLDLLTYAGNLYNLRAVAGDPRHTFVNGDICDDELVRGLLDNTDAILNLAAESHVDRSIADPAPFIRTNIEGTRVLLEAALEQGVSRFLQVSTDEVYGELPWLDPAANLPDRPAFSEDSPIRPRSPYAASKAGADLLALSFFETHGLDVVISRGSNNYGPHQHPEKLIPMVITRALAGQAVPVYGDGLHIRDWMFVEDFCSGILASLERGRAGEVYNFGGRAERTNLDLVRTLLDLLGLSESLISFVADRPGHDRRYAMDVSKAGGALGWVPQADFRSRLEDTVQWYHKRRAHVDRGCRKPPFLAY